MITSPLPFVGRTREQRYYQDLLGGEQPWVLMITGQGGIGKSTLLRHLAATTAPDIPVMHLNFADPSLRTDPLLIMEHLAWQMKPFCDQQPFQQFEHVLQQGRAELAMNVPMSETIIASEQAVVQGNQLSMSMGEKRRQMMIREKVRGPFSTLVETFRPAQVVFMLDTCEWFYETESVEIGQWLLDSLLAGIRMRLSQKRRRLSLVIGSRVPLRFEAVDEQEQRVLVLPMLERPAVDEYLHHIGIQDALFYQHVYHLTHGHALCVSIIATLWQEQAFTRASLPDVQASFTERALIKYVVERILDKRLQSPFRELTRYGVLLRTFNLPMLQAVFPKWNLNYEQFQQFVRYPYIESLGNHFYTVHELLRVIQAEEIQAQEPGQWQEYHQRARTYLTHLPDNADVYYHAVALDQEQGMSDWWDAVQTAYIQDASKEFSMLLQVIQDPIIKLTSANQALSIEWQGNFSRYNYQMEAALQFYEQALILFRQVGDRLGEANVLKAIGDVQQFRDEREAALQSYEQALTLFRQVGSKLGEANVLQAMGDILVGKKDHQQALVLYETAYKLYQYIQDNYSQARLLLYRSQIYIAMNESSLAIQDVKTALALAQRFNFPFVGLLQKILDELNENE